MSFSKIDWIEYYKNQAGGQYNYFRGSQFQRGYGLGGIYYQQGSGLGTLLRQFASWVVPLLKKHAIPTIQAGVKTLGREVLDSAADVAKDVISGKDLKLSATNRFNTAIDTLKEKVEKKLDGEGIKRKKDLKKYVILKKRKTSSKNRNSLDIFN
jgi:hypothetical protein